MVPIAFYLFLVLQQIFISEGHVLQNVDDRRRIVDEARSIIQSGITVIKSVVEKVPDEIDNKKPNETDWNKFNQSLNNFLDQQIQAENNIEDQNLIQNIKEGFQNITEEFLHHEDEGQSKQIPGMIKQLFTGGAQQVSSNLNEIATTTTTIATPPRPPGFISNILSQFTGNQANSTPQASVTGLQNNQSSSSTQAPNFFQNAVSNIISNFRPTTTTTTPNPAIPGSLPGAAPAQETPANQNNILQNIAQAIQNSFRPPGAVVTKEGLDNGMEVFACMNMAKMANRIRGKDNNEE